MVSYGHLGNFYKSTERHFHATVFEWNIPQFHEMIRLDYTGWSPFVTFMNNSFRLSIHCNHQKVNGYEDWIKIKVWIHDDNHRGTMYYKLAIKKANGTEEEILYGGTLGQNVNKLNSAKDSNEGLRESNLLKRWSELVPSNTLTVTCTLWSDNVEEKTHVSQETQTEDIPESGAKGEKCKDLESKEGDELRKHFKSLLLDGKDHDVIFKVGEKEFKAHKNILQARSPVFGAMFSHNMRESECGDVTVEDCDPKAFDEFLQFVYTGKLDNLTPSNAIGLYYAGDKYDFPYLKEMCVEYLKTTLSANTISGVITMAMKHSEQELLDCAMEFFTDHLVDILMTVEWQGFLVSNPIVANELTVKAMKSSYRKI